MANLKEFKDENGKFLWFAWPGGYAYTYLDKEANTFCPGCADGQDPEFDPPIISGYIHWEGPSNFCAGCNKEMPSEYGDPNVPECIRCNEEIQGKVWDAKQFEEYLSAEEPDADVVECEEEDKLCNLCAHQLLAQGKDYGCSKG